MAKKKTGKKAGAKKAPAKKVVKKPAAKGKPAPAKKATSAQANPFTVSTGKGASAAEVGKSLVELYNAGKWDEPAKLWWSPEIVSVEGMGMAWAGRDAVNAKNAGWYEQNNVLGGSAEGPYVGASGFAVKFRMEVQEKATGKRTRMEEVGVYTVQDGKIVREEYMYGSMQTEQMPVG